MVISGGFGDTFLVGGDALHFGGEALRITITGDFLLISVGERRGGETLLSLGGDTLLPL